jgi:CheY-like chemotaxis protein
VKFAAAGKRLGKARVLLTFTVSDTGIGIAPRDLKRLFQPFAQTSEAVARQYGGAGLSLVFVKRIAEAMGGDLKIARKPGRGTTFTLTLPGECVDVKQQAQCAANRVARALSVLCAEDKAYSRVVMNTILNELGHRVDFVESGEAAVQAVAIGGYDAVLMDVALPGADGFEATRRIRARSDSVRQVPVIGISGRGGPMEEGAARAAGMNVYLVKPVSPDKLARPWPRFSKISRLSTFCSPAATYLGRYGAIPFDSRRGRPARAVRRLVRLLFAAEDPTFWEFCAAVAACRCAYDAK